MNETPNAVDCVNGRYCKRIEALLGRISAAIEAAGMFTSGEATLLDGSDEYTYDFWISNKEFPNDAGDEDKIWVTFTIVEQWINEGEDKDGINFRLSGIKMGGEIVFELSPFNYTPDCWIDARNPYKVEERFKLMEEVDIPSILLCIIKS